MSNTFVLDSNYLARKRKEIKNEISYARYQVGGNWYQAKIETATVLSDGRVEATFVIDHTVSGNITVTGVELYDLNGATNWKQNGKHFKKRCRRGHFVCLPFFFVSGKRKQQQNRRV